MLSTKGANRILMFTSWILQLHTAWCTGDNDIDYFAFAANRMIPMHDVIVLSTSQQSLYQCARECRQYGRQHNNMIATLLGSAHNNRDSPIGNMTGTGSTRLQCQAFQYIETASICMILNVRSKNGGNSGFMYLRPAVGTSYFEKSESPLSLFTQTPTHALSGDLDYYCLLNATSAEECAGHCIDTPGMKCNSFAHSRRKGLCALSRYTVDKRHTLRDAENYDFYQYSGGWPCNLTVPWNYSPKQLATPGYPFLRRNTHDCFITIRPPYGKRVALTVMALIGDRTLCSDRTAGVFIYGAVNGTTRVCEYDDGHLQRVHGLVNEFVTIVMAQGSSHIVTRLKYDFEVKETCRKDTCRNGGICHMVNEGITCSCSTGYTGDRCEIRVRGDNCGSSPCLFNGECVNKPGGYTCTCLRGTTGKRCEIYLGECHKRPCRNGTCSPAPGASGYNCECTEGFTGKNCEYDVNECFSSPCVHGECVDTINGYKCTCYMGYSGLECREKNRESSCTPRDCKFGTCAVNVSGSYCQCFPGFTGGFCDTNINECEHSPCKHGTCIDHVNAFVCKCVSGYRGTHCDILSHDPCRDKPCNHGYCSITSSGFKCVCNSGFTGRLCDDAARQGSSVVIPTDSGVTSTVSGSAPVLTAPGVIITQGAVSTVALKPRASTVSPSLKTKNVYTPLLTIYGHTPLVTTHGSTPRTTTNGYTPALTTQGKVSLQPTNVTTSIITTDVNSSDKSSSTTSHFVMTNVKFPDITTNVNTPHVETRYKTSPITTTTPSSTPLASIPSAVNNETVPEKNIFENAHNIKDIAKTNAFNESKTTPNSPATTPTSKEYSTSSTPNSKGSRTGTYLNSKGYSTGTYLNSKGSSTGTNVTSKGFSTTSTLTSKGSSTTSTITSKGSSKGAYLTSKGSSTGTNVTSKGFSTTSTLTSKGSSTTSTITSKGSSKGAYLTSKGSSTGTNVTSKGSRTGPTQTSKGFSTSSTLTSKELSTSSTQTSKGFSTSSTLISKGSSTTTNVTSKGPGISSTLISEGSSTSSILTSKGYITSSTPTSKGSNTSTTTPHFVSTNTGGLNSTDSSTTEYVPHCDDFTHCGHGRCVLSEIGYICLCSSGRLTKSKCGEDLNRPYTTGQHVSTPDNTANTNTAEVVLSPIANNGTTRTPLMMPLVTSVTSVLHYVASATSETDVTSTRISSMTLRNFTRSSAPSYTSVKTPTDQRFITPVLFTNSSTLPRNTFTDTTSTGADPISTTEPLLSAKTTHSMDSEVSSAYPGISTTGSVRSIPTGGDVITLQSILIGALAASLLAVIGIALVLLYRRSRSGTVYISSQNQADETTGVKKRFSSRDIYTELQARRFDNPSYTASKASKRSGKLQVVDKRQEKVTTSSTEESSPAQSPKSSSSGSQTDQYEPIQNHAVLPTSQSDDSSGSRDQTPYSTRRKTLKSKPPTGRRNAQFKTPSTGKSPANVPQHTTNPFFQMTDGTLGLNLKTDYTSISTAEFQTQLDRIMGQGKHVQLNKAGARNKIHHITGTEQGKSEA